MIIMFLAYFGKGENGNQFGGAEKVFANMANWFANNCNHKIVFASVGTDALPFPLDSNVLYKHYDADLSNRIKTQFSLRRNIRKAIEENNPTVIISFSIHPLFHFALSSYSKRIPFFYSLRNDPKLENGIITRLLRFFVLVKATGIVFQTTEARNYFSKRVQSKSIIIHNPVQISNNTKIVNSRDERIVFVGRLTPQKNIPLLIRGFQIISKEFPELKLELYGEGNLHSEIKDIILNEQLQDRVFLKGAFADVIDRISGAKMFVLPSLYEGMPNALMEAMALGIPAVSSDCPCGGPRELINDGVNGYLFENNSLDSLVKKMIECLNNQDIVSLSNNERQIIHSHSPMIIYQKWLSFIEEKGMEKSRCEE